MDIKTEEQFNPKDVVAIMGTNAQEKDFRNWNQSSENIREMALVVRLNTNCNFDCKYCSMHDYDKFVQDPKVIKQYLKVFIENIYNVNKETNNYDGISYYFYGGEPTYYKYFDEIINFIHDYHMSLSFNYLIEIQTNLTKPISFFKKLLESNINIRFVCSYQNTEQQKLQNYQEKYKETSRFLIENNMTIGFDIMLEDPFSEIYKNEIVKPKPEDIADLFYFYKEMLTKYNNFGLQMNTINSKPVPKVYQNLYNECGKVSEKLKVVLKHDTGFIQKTVLYNDIISNGHNNYFGFTCEAGLRQLSLHFASKDVKLYRCFSETFYDKDNPLFNSKTKTLDDFSNIIIQQLKPVKCIFRTCVCEVYLKKYKSNKFKNILDSSEVRYVP